MDAKKTGTYLASLRKNRQMTQQSVADALNLSNKTISKWESGAGLPDISVLPALAELYGVTADEILAGEALTQGGEAQRIEIREKQKYLLGRAALKVEICLVFAMVLASLWAIHVPTIDLFAALLCPALVLIGWLLLFHTTESERAIQKDVTVLAARWTLPVLLIWEWGNLGVYKHLIIANVKPVFTAVQLLRIFRWEKMIWALSAILTMVLLQLLVKKRSGRKEHLLPSWLLFLTMGGLLEYGLVCALQFTQYYLEEGAAVDREVLRALKLDHFFSIVPALEISVWVLGISVVVLEGIWWMRRQKREIPAGEKEAGERVHSAEM